MNAITVTETSILNYYTKQEDQAIKSNNTVLAEYYNRKANEVLMIMDWLFSDKSLILRYNHL